MAKISRRQECDGAEAGMDELFVSCRGGPPRGCRRSPVAGSPRPPASVTGGASMKRGRHGNRPPPRIFWNAWPGLPARPVSVSTEGRNGSMSSPTDACPQSSCAASPDRRRSTGSASSRTTPARWFATAGPGAWPVVYEGISCAVSASAANWPLSPRPTAFAGRAR